jgi:hypothetical protein
VLLWLASLLQTEEVLDSILVLAAGYPESLHGFHHFFQANAEIALKTGHNHFTPCPSQLSISIPLLTLHKSTHMQKYH